MIVGEECDSGHSCYYWILGIMVCRVQCQISMTKRVFARQGAARMILALQAQSRDHCVGSLENTAALTARLNRHKNALQSRRSTLDAQLSRSTARLLLPQNNAITAV